MEKCNFEGTEIDLPIDLIESPEIFSHVMSLDTWKHVLTPENRNHLKNYLPVLPTDYPHAQQDNLRALFGENNFKFGNPLQTFQRKLHAGYYASDIVKYRKRCKKAKRKEYKLKLKKFYRKLVNDILVSRQEIIDQVLSTSHQEVPITLSWHERQMHKSSSLTGNLECKYKRIMKEVKDECEDKNISSDEEPSDLSPYQHFLFNGGNHSGTFHSDDGDFVMSTPTASAPSSVQLTVTEDDYNILLRSHRRKRENREVCPDMDTRMISLEDVVSRINVTTKKISKTVVKKKIKVKEKKELHIKKLKKKRNVPSVVLEQPTVVPTASVDTEKQVVATVNVQDDSISIKSFKYLENNSACFFSLLRDIFVDLPEATAELQQIERMVKEWQKSSSCSASSWSFKESNWVDLIPSALKFLAGGIKEPSFLPLVVFKQKVHHWKWIGAYRDEDSELDPMCDHWFETKDDTTNPVEPPSASPESSLRTDYVVGPSTNDEKSDYQKQERERYENPHKPFIYQMHGFDSIVAPVKGVFTKESNLNKAREHSLLVSKRPPYVTILTLVRDSAARLPNGEGTRAEVCQLLKDSQYINPDATDGQIHTVVSGALDRLHYEKDPCVKYESARKVWIYLHKTRSVEEFEKIHEASAAAARAKKQMSQKQKQMKQQQKAKETAMSVSNVAQTLSTVEEGDGIIEAGAETSAEVLPIASPVPIPKAKRPTKPKRPSASSKKTDKSKGNAKKGSLNTLIPTQPSKSRPAHLEGDDVLSSLPPPSQTQPNPGHAVDFKEEQSIFLPTNSSAFSRTSRLNSPFMGIPPPVLDNPPFGNQSASYGLNLHDKSTGVGESSSSSDSESESESGSESSSSNEVTRQGLAIPEHRDTDLHFVESRMPLNSVNMALGQRNPNGTESDSTFSRYY